MNQHAEQSIDAYLDAETLPVPHALLVEGAWGSGKTYYLAEIYQKRRANRLAHERKASAPLLIVSLFGATSAEEAQLRIYRSANPAEAAIGNLVGEVAKSVGEFFNVKDAAKSVVGKMGSLAATRLNDYVLVLDDLERIEPDAFGEIMGLVNKFVAENGRRVILVTDETKLRQLQPGNF